MESSDQERLQDYVAILEETARSYMRFQQVSCKTIEEHRRIIRSLEDIVYATRDLLGIAVAYFGEPEIWMDEAKETLLELATLKSLKIPSAEIEAWRLVDPDAYKDFPEGKP